MALKDTCKAMKSLLESILDDLEKAEAGNKAAAQRVRTSTIKFEKTAKSYRKESIKADKSGLMKKVKQAAKKKPAAPAKKAAAKPAAPAKKAAAKPAAPAKKAAAKPAAPAKKAAAKPAAPAKKAAAKPAAPARAAKQPLKPVPAKRAPVKKAAPLKKKATAKLPKRKKK